MHNELKVLEETVSVRIVTSIEPSKHHENI